MEGNKKYIEDFFDFIIDEYQSSCPYFLDVYAQLKKTLIGSNIPYHIESSIRTSSKCLIIEISIANKTDEFDSDKVSQVVMDCYKVLTKNIKIDDWSFFIDTRKNATVIEISIYEPNIDYSKYY